MDLEIVWTIARKDLSTFRKKRGVFYSTIILPLVVSVGLPALIWFLGGKANIPDATLNNLLTAFSFVFVIIASVITTAISSYSIVGEKVEKSLEPLLASPATDGEILLGKSLAAFLPTLIAIYIGMGVFMTLIDLSTVGQLGYLYDPNWSVALILLVVAPLAIVLSVGVNILVSSRVNDVRTASQLGALMVLPFAVIYVGSELGAISLDTSNLLIISAVLLVADVAVYYLSRATFRREEILTKWK
jgi:ABC-2 type transport system permease protein